MIVYYRVDENGVAYSQDGNMVCAVNMETFQDLAVSDAGFGETEEEAVADLRRQEGSEG